MLEDRTETGRNEQGMTLRRKLLQGALVLVLALAMLMAFAPQAHAAGAESSFATTSTTSINYGGGWGGWGGYYHCPNCTIYNHNETLVEDDHED